MDSTYGIQHTGDAINKITLLQHLDQLPVDRQERDDLTVWQHNGAFSQALGSSPGSC